MSWRTVFKHWCCAILLALAGDRLVGLWLLPLYAPERPVVRTGTASVNHAYGHLRGAVLARADMLVVGSSRAITNYQDELLSRELKLRVFNAGSPGMGVLQARATLALARRHHPVRFLVLDCVFVPNEDRMVHQLEPWLGSDPVVDEVLAGDWREWLKTRSFAYRCGGSLFDLAEDYGRAGPAWGYQNLQEQLVGALDLRANLPRELPAWFSHHLEALALDCRAAGVQLILSDSPTHLAISQEEPVVRAYRHLSQKYTLLHLTAPEILDRGAYFHDSLHLNQEGSELFSRSLAAKIRAGLGGPRPGIQNGPEPKELP